MPFRRQYELLRRARDYRLLFFASATSGLGTYLAVIALIVDVYDRTHSGAWVSALLIVEFLPILVIGLTLGPLVDRLPRRSLMVGADLVRLGVFVALPFAPSALSIVVLAGIAGFATGFFRPAVYAGLPNLVDDADLPQANGLLLAVDSLAWMIGPIVGGALLAAFGPDPAYFANAATFLASALLLLGISVAKLQQQAAGEGSHLGELREGFRAVGASRALLTVLVAWSIVMIGNGSMNVSEVVLVKDSLSGGDLGLGVLMGAAGLGLMVGSLLGGAWVERRPMAEAYSSAIGLMALGAGLTAISPTVWVAVPFLAICGVGNGVASVCNPVLVQRGAPDKLRGRVFTVIISVNSAVLGLAMAAAGPFTDAFGARWIWGVAACAYAVAAAVGLVLARPIRAPERVEVTPVTVMASGAPQAGPPPERV